MPANEAPVEEVIKTPVTYEEDDGSIYEADGSLLLEVVAPEEEVKAMGEYVALCINEHTHLVSENTALTKWRIAYEHLTPNGSEWVNDLPKCEAYVQRRLLDNAEDKKALVRAKRELEAKDAEIQRLRDVVVEALEPGVFGLQDRSGIHAPEDEMVMDLGRRIGFGALMDAASRMWAIVAKKNGHEGSEFTCGPCAAVRRGWIERATEALEEQSK